MRRIKSVPALIAAPIAFLAPLLGKMTTKVGIYPVTKLFGSPRKEAIYTTLLMSTGLIFGTISAVFGLSQGIIDHRNIPSAVVPTMIANAFFMPRYLLTRDEHSEGRNAHPAN